VGQAISSEHPAVVLRSRYQQLRALLAVALVAVVALGVTVVILAVDDGTDVAIAPEPVSAPSSTGHEETDTATAIGTAGDGSTQTGPDDSVVDAGERHAP